MRPKPFQGPLATLLTLALVVTGCSGSVSQRGGRDDDSPEQPGRSDNNEPETPSAMDDPVESLHDPGDPKAAGPQPLRRLSRREYDNTVRDLLGDASRPARAFPSDHDTGFLFSRPGVVAVHDAKVLRDAAESLAAQVASSVTRHLPCNPSGQEPSCARQFIATFGLRAYRRPLTTQEATRLEALYNRARTTLQLGFTESVGLLVEAMLQSPAFLYHWEVDDKPTVREANVVRLSAYQMASRLSYLLSGSMPDAELFAAAAADELQTDEQIAAQVGRLLEGPRAQEAVSAFFGEWLSVHRLDDMVKDPTAYPNWSEALKRAMANEISEFSTNVVFRGEGTLKALFDATFSFVNEPLARVYGVNGVSGETLRRTDLNPQQRRGLLTMPSFLALNAATDGSHPVRRGHAIFEHMLCHEMPPPPPDVPPAEPVASGGTTRERFDVHASNPCARSCHGILDPLGFALEHYDGIGAFRTMEAGKPVDATATILLDEVEREVDGAPALATAMAESHEVADCFVRQWFRFAMGRREVQADQNSLYTTVGTFRESGGRLADLIGAIATSRSFRYRIPASGEVLP